MIEATGKQLVGGRLKGPGMHWTEQAALAMTALRATEFNDDGTKPGISYCWPTDPHQPPTAPAHKTWVSPELRTDTPIR